MAETVGAMLICAGLASGVVALVVLHILPTGLSPLRNAVSQYGITPYRAGYRAQTLSFAVAGTGAAIGLAKLPGSTALVVGLCAVFALSRAAISWFPMDAPGAERSITGRRHGLLAIAAFVSVTLAAQRLASLLNQERVHAGIAAASTGLAAVMAVSLIAMAINRRARTGSFGLIERVFYLCTTAWLAVVAALLLSR